MTNFKFILYNMSLETTNSGSIQNVTETRYLINTSKTVKGHKITLKDNIRKQLIKCRNLSQSKKVKPTVLIEENNVQVKYTEYTQKYRALQTIQETEDLLKFIIYQRIKNSRESQRGMKLFSRQKARPMTSSIQSEHSARFASSRPSKTSHSLRTQRETSKNLSYQIRNSFNSPSKTSTIVYSSENLDARMNQYMNLVLQKKIKDDLLNPKQNGKNNEENIQLKQEQNFIEQRNKHRNLTNTFFRNMKKNLKGKKENNFSTIQTDVGSNELVKSLQRRTQQNVKSIGVRTKSTWRKTASNFHSIEMRVRPDIQGVSQMQKLCLRTFTPSTRDKQTKDIPTAFTTARKEVQ